MDRPVRVRRPARERLPRFVLAPLLAIRRGLRASSAADRTEQGATPAGSETPATGIARPGVQHLYRTHLKRGLAPEAAASVTVRDLVKDHRTGAAVSFADMLAAEAKTATAGHLAAGIVGVHRRLPELARTEFREVPLDLWRAHATSEYLTAAYLCDREEAVDAVRQLLADRPADLGPQAWFEVLRFAFVTGELESARQAYDLLARRAGDRPEEWGIADVEIAWLKPWMAAEAGATAPQPVDGRIPFALIDYRQPGRAKTSANIGDHVQTLASLGHLVRHENVRFHGPADLTGFVGEMQQRVRAERRLQTSPSDVALYTLDRDASTFEAFPEGTWLLAFGWYMHPLFGLRHDFPMHPNLRPIFVSFHCSKRQMLNEQAVEYLRRYAPVGCRDWTTVDLLLSLGVPAFFSGCLTTTVDTVFPPDPGPAEPATVYVDVPADQVPEGAPTARHSYGAVKQNDFVTNMRDAVTLLERYRQNFTSVVTPRLHCYLPSRSLGLGVDFRPSNRADIRFNGLIDIDETEFETIRSRMLARLQTVLSTILAGSPQDEVYRVWREACADDVAFARERHTAGAALPAPSLNVVEATKLVRAATVTTGPDVSDAVDVLIRVAAGDVRFLRHTLESVRARASRPIRLWLLAWGCGPKDHERIADAFPDLAVHWLPCDSLTRDVAMTLLPELLGDVERITVLPPAAVVLGDVVELAEWDLGGHPLAARTSLGTSASSGFGRFYKAAQRLHPDAEAAHDLFRRVHERHVFDFDAFDTDVLVADLARMRADGSSDALLPYLERFRMSSRELLTLYTGPDRAVLPPAWAHTPSNERVADPKLVHWPGTAKPWTRRYVARQELWEQPSAAADR
ncbi:MAG: hypothetical protein GEV10_23690 [Streptosporangiales bacterium]|nr:hypothetical protein [Streptosporangiales bacterium]